MYQIDGQTAVIKICENQEKFCGDRENPPQFSTLKNNSIKAHIKFTYFPTDCRTVSTRYGNYQEMVMSSILENDASKMPAAKAELSIYKNMLSPIPPPD
ncbi:hypothetical protein [[Phormidium] sp. ETS-05]|uniref:hypothetical protein n=1 Tax=[Phormidium] sp. ETS-05 TaxID=222819 RepID=UPI0018EEE14C|nr:hypothetical protein [[Phormidium] sp. ETS-05]